MEYDVADVRGSMPTGRFWSRLTGKALPKQQPLYHSTPASHFMYATGIFLAGTLGAWVISSSLFALSAWFLTLLPVAWLLQTSGARYLTVSIHHQCVHHEFSGSRFWDRVVGEFASIVTLTQPFDGYQVEHVNDHHSTKLATILDPDFVFLRRLGFRPGMKVKELWRHLYWTLVSPVFHWKFLKVRLRSNFVTAWPHRIVLSVLFVAGLLAFACSTHMWLAFLCAYVFPMIFFYQLSSLLQFLSEHQWARVRLPGESKKLHLARLTTGRFCGEMAPTRNLPLIRRIAAWAGWMFKMFFVHAPIRLFVLPGDLVVHDWHHRAPRISSWPDAIYARQRDVDAGCPGWPEPPIDIWGLGNAIQRLFEFWASLPVMPEPPEFATPDEVFVPYPQTFGIPEHDSLIERN